MTEEERELLITLSNAIQYLLTPEKDRSISDKAVMQSNMRETLNRLATAVSHQTPE